MKRLALIVIALAASTTAASAYDSGRQIDAREAAQARRIEHARRTGQLTWFESAKLKAEQRRIHRLEAWAKRDGHLSREEARRIEAAQDQAARNIYRESHDGQTAKRRVW